MDITKTSKQRFAMGIELFLEGKENLSYKSVSFYREGKSILLINSYSAFSDTNLITQQEAKEKINHSKLIFSELCNASPIFHTEVMHFSYQYEFLCDYGTGAVLVASEINNNFKWMLKP